MGDALRLLPLAGAVLLPLALVAVRPAPPAAAAPAAAAPAVAAPLAADSAAWENLRVLPDSLTRDELTALMRGFNDALGVRCSHCHVRAGEEWNFPSDDKAHKRTARGMIRMTQRLNRDALPEIEGLDGSVAAVTCYTCHRGQTRPAASPADTAAAGRAP